VPCFNSNYLHTTGIYVPSTSYYNMKNFHIVTVIMVMFTTSFQAQINVFETPSPGVSIIPQRTYSQSEGQKFNKAEYFSHPDFGKLTFDAPYDKHVVEDLSKRKPDERYYTDLDNPTYFYIQKSSNPINFYENGVLRAIDPTLYPAGNGSYTSGAQPCPTALNTLQKSTSITFGSETFSFNNYSLRVTHNDNSTTSHEANWSNIAIGNNGAYVTDVFPGIDMLIRFREAEVESDFIIRENLNVKRLEFTDHLQIPANLNGFIFEDQEIPGAGMLIFDNIYNGDTEIKFDQARCHDASENKHSWVAPYTFTGNLLTILCDSAILNDPLMVYPIVVDPVVTAVGPIASGANIIGSLRSPANCAHTINVTFPGGSTPWDVSAGWALTTNYCYGSSGFGFYDDCWNSEAQIWITTACGGVSPVGGPGTIWTCLGCNYYGTWNPTLPFSGSGSQSLAQCFTPSCANQTLGFTIHSNRSYCATYGAYDACNYATSICNRMQSWNVTVQGRTAETLVNTATGNGSQFIPSASCFGTALLNPAALYGVSPYTYNWSTGATTSTINVTNVSGTTTCIVTDACGTARTASFTVTCPLAIELESFEAIGKENESLLKWTTSFEKDNDYFALMRAGSNGSFSEIGRIKSQGNSEQQQFYQFTDTKPLPGINYYQLNIIDINGEITQSDVRLIDHEMPANHLSILPNPNNGTFELGYKVLQKGTYQVTIISALGKTAYDKSYLLEKGNQAIKISTTNLEPGMYVVKISNGISEISEKMMVSH